MIPRIVELSLRRRLVIILATALVAVLGVRAFLEVPIEAYPDIADTQVQIISQWPGHAAEELERFVTLPIERVVYAVPHQVAVRSVSIAGLSVVTVTFAEGTGDYFARAQTIERLARAEVPDGVAPQLGPLASPIGEILRYRLVSCPVRRVPECTDEDVAAEPRSLSDLKDLEEWVVERELLRVDGVADVTSFGGTLREYQVHVDPGRLVARGLGLSEVEAALAAANGSGGGRVVAFGPEALNVRAIGLLRPDEIGEVSLTEQRGSPVRVRDVASVEVGYRPRLGRVSVDDDADVVAALVLLRRGDDARRVLDRVHARIEELNARVLPRGVRLAVYHDRSELMALTTRTVLENLVAGIGLVTLVLFVFLGSPRAAFVAALTIPLSLLVAFIGMDVAGIPANLLSIGAVDFGMIVDGSIVMVENVFRRVAAEREKSHSVDLVATVRDAAREVARPIVFAIAIIVAAYLPIFTLERVEGRLFRPMAFTVGFALVGAVLLAITFVPVLASYVLRGEIRERRNPILAVIRKAYLPLVGRLLARPRLVFVAIGILLAADFAMYQAIGSEFLPHLNEGALWVRASMPGNISLEEAEHLLDGYDQDGTHVRGIRETLREFPEVRTSAVQLGRPDEGTDPTGFFNAEILLVLEDRARWRPELHGDRERLEDEMRRALATFPGVAFGFSQPISDNVEEALTGVKGQLAIKIVGDDLSALDDLATRIAHEVRGVPGVTDLGIFREVGQSNLHVEISRERAQRVGASFADVQRTIEAGVGGAAVTSLVKGERRHDLVVRYREDARSSAAEIARLPIATEHGHPIPLAEVATVRVEGGAARIFREDGRRYVGIKFGIRDRDLGSTVAEAQARVARAIQPPAGYEIRWGGEFESAERAGRRLSIVIPLTLALIFALLVAMFRSAREALLILGNVLITSPFGGLAALLVSGTNLSVSAGVGFLALFGASVQTGVILIAYIVDLRRAGVGVDDAIRAAVDVRLRPIVMMALVATLGLVPAALSTGIGSDSQRPLAIVVVGGLVSSLTLSLFTLPLLYKVFAGAVPASAGPAQPAEPAKTEGPP